MRIINVLKFLWLLPATILVWVFYVLPLWVTRQISFLSWTTAKEMKIPIFILENYNSVYGRLWRDWAGWSGPWVIIVKEYNARSSSTILHEAQHCDDQATWGVFFYPAYLFHSLYLWLFCKDKHSYIDNYFERRARKAAWQKVDIPRDQWMHGPDDRWAWW